MQESPFEPEEPVNFTGEIQFCAADQAEADAITVQVRRGLRWTTSFGAERTAGFGRLGGVDVQALQKPVALASASVGTSRSLVAAAASPTRRWGLVIRPLAPFCIARKLPIANVFESDSTISGGVLKGALAQALKALVGLPHDAEIDGTIPAPWDVLGRHLDRVRFTHAFPAKRGCRSRPTQPPLSLVKDGSATLHDIALLDGPVLLGEPPSAPTFAIDWKDSSDVRQAYGWARPATELRVRTAIDRIKRRALDENLFAYEMIVPNDHEWPAILDISVDVDAADLPPVEDRLRDLLGCGLLAIGKTKARVQIDLIPESQLGSIFASNAQPLIIGGRSQWIVTLQTPTLLCDPFRLDETSGELELRNAYSDVWAQFSGGSLSLVRLFASQSLMGRYIVERFHPDKPYNPFLLTDAGSVFVVEAMVGQEPVAQTKIDTWLRNGLPLPDWAVKRYGDGWKTCPFRPVNGFGEIAVNLPCHTSLMPQETPFHVIS